MNQSGGGIVGVDFDPAVVSDAADPPARDQAMKSAAVDYIVRNPGRFLELAGVKFLRLWRPWPYAPAYATPFVTVVLTMSIVPVLIFGCAGAVWGAARYSRFYVPIILFIGYTTAVHMITIASIRYRFPIEPMLVILAAPLVAAILRGFAGVELPRSLELRTS